MEEKYNYYYINNIELIDSNIMKNGENLSIVVLSCNKSELTIRLLESIVVYLKDFKGEIIVFDNNSIRRIPA